jgi:hypothetical protein
MMGHSTHESLSPKGVASGASEVIGVGIMNQIERIRDAARSHWTRFLLNRQMDRAELDPRIKFPCYKSLDDFIDVERLKGLNGYLEEYLLAHSKAVKDEEFHTGDLTISAKAKKTPGSRIIYLSKSSRPFKYFDLDKSGTWTQTPQAEELPRLMEFIATLPFKSTARMMIMYDTNGGAVTPHRDHARFKKLHEFVWFRPNLRKPFFLLDRRSGKREYVKSYTAWFDTVNQFHGADAVDGLSISLRVDGQWTDEFRQRIPTPACNAASTPSLWASI